MTEKDAVQITPCGSPKRLDHLPLMGQILRDLRVAELVDDRIPPHQDRVVSVGTCVEAMVLAILQGSHTLYRVGDALRTWDLGVLLGREVKPEQLSDDKLGRSLDRLFGAGVSGINTAIMLSALDRYDLSTSWLHYDTTSISVQGAYANSVPGDPEDPDGAPHIARGHSKDHRPDLKQVVFGLSVTGDGNIPLIGRITDGNRSDSKENGFNLARLAAVLPDPTKTTVVADCKLFSGHNLLLARKHGLRVLTLLPRTANVWGEAFENVKAKLADAPILREIVRITESGEERSEEVLGTWRGRSTQVVYNWKEKGAPKKSPTQEFPLRAIVVQSTELRSKKTKTWKRLVAKERRALEQLAKRFARKEFHCEADAQAEGEREVAGKDVFHDLTVAVTKEVGVKKRSKRGRPRKDDPTPMYDFYRVQITHELNAERHADWIERESAFILVTSPEIECSDAEALEVYKNQSGVEQAFRWLKGPARVAPIFLHTPSRIAALGLVYIIAIMVQAILQRRVRALLKEHGKTIPSTHRSVRTNKPTAEVVRGLMAGILSMPIVLSNGYMGRWITGVTTEHEALFQLLGVTLLDDPHVLVKIAPPKPAERGYRAPKGVPRVGYSRAPSAQRKPSRTWTERRTVG